MAPDRSYAVEVTLPAEAFRHQVWSPALIAEDLRVLWQIDQVRQRHVGVALANFLRRMADLHLSAFDLDEPELQREIATGLALGRR